MTQPYPSCASAAELDELAFEVRTAPEVTDSTIGAARRLAQLDPDNQQACAVLRLAASPARGSARCAGRPIEWRPCPAECLVGLPVHAWSVARRLQVSDPDASRAMHEESGRFLVACGLALQALRRAAVDINLLRAKDQGLLGKLRSGLRERPPTAAWGIDLGNAALKAVRVTMDAEDRALVTHCVLLPHRQPLTRPEAQGDRAALVRETLDAFSARRLVDAADRVAVNWPVVRTLVRFLRLPAAEGRKLRGMLELEARSQIPFPLEEVCWETFLFPRSPSTPQFEPLQVLLLAARWRDIDDRVAQFGQAGIPVHVVQCDALALHNFVQFDRGDHEKPEACDQAASGVAVLDIGTEMTNVVWSFPNLVWFRGCRPAADDLVSTLVSRFQLTHEAAERLARNPSRAERYRDVQDTFREVFRKLVSQYEGYQLEFRKSMSPGAAREMLVAGGGARIPGLLRYLRHGR